MSKWINIQIYDFQFCCLAGNFLMIDFSLETMRPIYCFTAVSRTVGWMVVAPCNGHYNSCWCASARSFFVAGSNPDSAFICYELFLPSCWKRWKYICCSSHPNMFWMSTRILRRHFFPLLVKLLMFPGGSMFESWFCIFLLWIIFSIML